MVGKLRANPAAVAAAVHAVVAVPLCVMAAIATCAKGFAASVGDDADLALVGT